MALDHAIMTALLDEPMSGYELTRAFDTSLGFFWKASHQQIYKALRVLEKQGLLASEDVPQAGKPDKVVYCLTAAGRQALDTWVMTSESRVKETKDDLFVKLYNLSSKNSEHIRREIARRAGETRDRLTLYQRIRERHFAKPETLSLRRRGIYLALLAGIRHCEMYLEWVAETESLLAGTPEAEREARLSR
jgi:DNA-binding PadR family transcriptional regulator